MHEMALMAEIMNVVQKDADMKKISLIHKVELMVGDISNVLPDALMLAFDICKEQNPHFIANTAILSIKREEAKAICGVCNQDYIPEQRLALCPHCNLPSGKIISGETFQILSYEGDEQS